jgi:hypothetical protein
MTAQEIQERNKQIALMLDWEQYQNSEERWFGHWKPSTTLEKPWSIRVERLEFDSDWNWLMTAAKFMLDIVSENDDMETWYSFTDQLPDIEAAFVMLSDFAKEHNKNK